MASITRGYGITDLNDLHPLDLLVSLRKTLVVQLAALRQEKLHPAELLQQQWSIMQIIVRIHEMHPDVRILLQHRPCFCKASGERAGSQQIPNGLP